MKIKAIAAICRKSKEARILTGTYGEQYIGNSEALYQVNGLPQLDKESLLTVFDVPAKARENWNVTCQELQDELNMEKQQQWEELELMRIKLEVDEKKMMPLVSSQGVVFVDTEYLKPLQGVGDYTKLCAHYTKSGKLLIVVKVGLIVRALIWPEEMRLYTINKLERMAELARLAVDNGILLQEG